MPRASEDTPPKKVTARDVADLAGVSKWTVSRAFTDGASVAPKVRESILAVAKELGYTPNLLARSLSTRRSNLVALVVDELANPNLLRLLNETTRQLQARGYSSMLLNSSMEYSPGEALRLADQFQVDGIMFLGTTLTSELIHLAQDIKHIPLVVLMRTAGQSNIQFVSTDGFAAGEEIAELFLTQGYQRVAYMAGPMSERTELRRLEGFKDGLQRCRVTLSAVLETAHYSRQEGMNALLRYLAATPRSERVEAIFCENDILAIGAMDALVEANVLGKIAIVGFDDIELAASPSYALTTFRQPVDYLVSEAINRIFHEGKAPQGSMLAPGTLVLRASHRRTA
jgi:DNA-binding LacI/PurR family transcriptional regulator